jgi:glyoxylase-like metal-dependent hydrolase (beta-lactamase superfamily II)
MDMILETLEVGPLAVNCYVLGSRDGEEGAVIDPGADADQIMRVIEDSGLSGKIRYILATHGHFDHVGAVKTLKDATSARFLIHKGDVELLDILQDQASYFGRWYIPPVIPRAGYVTLWGKRCLSAIPCSRAQSGVPISPAVPPKSW